MATNDDRRPAPVVAAVHDRRKPALAERRCTDWPARLAESCVWLYQKTLSPALAAAFPSCGCRFHPTCSHYARAALREHGLLAGGALTLRRLARCGPWHPGGVDPVPARLRPVCTRMRGAT